MSNVVRDWLGVLWLYILHIASNTQGVVLVRELKV